MKPLAITKERAAALDLLVSLSPAELEKVRQGYKSISIDYPKYSDILMETKKYVQSEYAEKIISVIVSLRKTADNRKVSSSQIIESAETGLTKFGWNDEQVLRLRQRKQIISSIIDLHIIRNSYKLADIYFDIGPVLNTIKVTTEITPIFNNERSRIECFILQSKLKIRSSSDTEDVSVKELFLEKEELEFLREECDRALKKLDAAQAQLKSDYNAQVVLYAAGGIMGDEEI